MGQPRKKQRRVHPTSPDAADTQALTREIPEWLEQLRITVENETPLMKTLLQRSVAAVLNFDRLSEEAAVKAAGAATDLGVLIAALSSPELIDDIANFEPLARAFVRGIQARTRLLSDHDGTLTAKQAGEVLGITPQAVEKRRIAGRLLAVKTGRHGYLYPAWQFTDSGVLPGLEDVLKALAPHDAWMQTAFFVGANPRLGDRMPLELLKAGKISDVLGAAEVYGEHGAA